MVAGKFSQCHMLYHSPKGESLLHGTMMLLRSAEPCRPETLNPSAISYEPKINSRAVHSERNRAGEQIDMRIQEGNKNKDG